MKTAIKLTVEVEKAIKELKGSLKKALNPNNKNAQRHMEQVISSLIVIIKRLKNEADFM